MSVHETITIMKLCQSLHMSHQRHKRLHSHWLLEDTLMLLGYTT